jgi:hypothetical protein
MPGATLIAAWGVLGVLVLFGNAVWRLTPLALEPIADGSLTAWQGVLYAAWVVFNAWAEGYRAFQRAFGPRVVRRAFELAADPRPLRVALAPAYCLSLFAAPRRRVAIAWATIGGVASLVVAVRLVPQPWRGIIDGGVVVALAWGFVVMVVEFARAVVLTCADRHRAAGARRPSESS